MDKDMETAHGDIDEDMELEKQIFVLEIQTTLQYSGYNAVWIPYDAS